MVGRGRERGREWREGIRWGLSSVSSVGDAVDG